MIKEIISDVEILAITWPLTDETGNQYGDIDVFNTCPDDPGDGMDAMTVFYQDGAWITELGFVVNLYENPSQYQITETNIRQSLEALSAHLLTHVGVEFREPDYELIRKLAFKLVEADARIDCEYCWVLVPDFEKMSALVLKTIVDGGGCGTVKEL